MPSEYLQPRETKTARTAQTTAAPESLPSPATIEALFADRQTMFASFERYVPVRMREQIREKIAREKKTLSELVERQRALRARAQKAIHVLHKSYFKQKKLDISSFE